MDSNNFSKREWLLIILLIMIVQFIVQCIAFLYAGSGSALNYISISGTIVSIVLALLAIIYSYFQSASQVNTSASLNTQIEKLISIVDKVKESKNDFSDELKNLENIREKIESSISIQLSSHSKVAEISETLDNFLENNITHYSSNSETDKFSRLVSEGSTLVHLVLLVLHKSIKAGIAFKKIFPEICIPLIDELDKKLEEQKISEDFYQGGILAILNLFVALGIVEVEDESLVPTVTSQFEKDLEEFYDFIKSREEDFYKIIVNTLNLSNGDE
ncbi:MAG: hypothetical protein O2793_12565 [Proteobacteria bacterium]|nr:hypothetical protein [Acinetobacter venetianus]MDA0697229.1 hypothetical protein [Pseudomonadota bacterium]MDA1255351.1 hypothetical protein [Pseudomonadota bacterium]